MKAKHIFITLGIVAVGVTAIVLISNRKSDKSEEEPKGEGEVSSHTKKNTTITFTRG